MANFPKFSEWVELREEAARKMVKAKYDNKISPGTRNQEDDLSSDYKGFIAQNGTVEPYKTLGKGGKAVAPVGK